jgi:NAD-dependent deacetylase
LVKKNIDSESLYKEVARLMAEQRQCVALTGAGVSAESGIPTFRSKGGLWEKYDPIEFASIEAFRKDPSKYWSLRGEFIKDYDRYQPNKAHLALAELEQMGIVRCVITQNIDGLHKKAGSKNVTEIHGNLMEIYCFACGKEYKAPNIPEEMPPHCSCGGILKPNTVLFGEELPMDVFMKAKEASAGCRIMLLVGTSAIVQPAASLPYLAKQNGAKIIEINIENAFPDADYFIKEKAGTALPKIVGEIDKIRRVN